MFPTLSPPPSWVCAAALLSPLPVFPASLAAQTTTVTYELDDVWLLPDISQPRLAAQQMTGKFEWTYTPGDFENGSGVFLEASIPWYGTAVGALNVTLETKSMEFVLPGNFHDTGLDLTLFLLPALAACQTSNVDTVRSSFDIERNGIAYKGHVISGSIVPLCLQPAGHSQRAPARPSGFGPPLSSSPLRTYGSGSPGTGAFVPRISTSGGAPRQGNEAFQINCDRLPGGASCLVLLGFGRDRLPAGGTNLLVAPVAWRVIPRRATGVEGVSGAGVLRLPLSIPDDARLVGLELDVQVLALDPGTRSRIVAASESLTLVVRPRP